MSQIATPPSSASQPAAAAAGPIGAAGLHFAGFWIRVLAMLIDSVIVTVLSFAIGMIVSLLALSGMATPGQSMAAVETSMLVTYLAVLITGIVYYIAFLSSRWQATPGKRFVGVYVMTRDGRRLSAFHAFGRYLAYIVSLIPFYIGFLMAGFTREKTALHDIICGTRVVYGRKDRAPA